jgi:hypothetical protein
MLVKPGLKCLAKRYFNDYQMEFGTFMYFRSITALRFACLDPQAEALLEIRRARFSDSEPAYLVLR